MHLHSHSVLSIPGHGQEDHGGQAPHIGIKAPPTQENWKEELSIKQFLLLLLTPKLNKYSHPLFIAVNALLLLLSLASVVILVLSTDTYLLGTFLQARTAIFTCDAICVAFFTLEYLLLLYASPDYSRFKSPSYIVNLLTTVPFYLEVIITLSLSSSDNFLIGFYTRDAVSIVAFFRVLRMCRMFKLLRWSSKLRLLIKAVKDSLEGLVILALLFVMIIVFFSSLVYYAERSGTEFRDGAWYYTEYFGGGLSPFQSIPDVFWLVLITLTTLGIGGAIPVTLLGRLALGITMFASLFMIAFPLSWITLQYSAVIRSFAQHKRQKALMKQGREVPSSIFEAYCDVSDHAPGDTDDEDDEGGEARAAKSSTGSVEKPAAAPTTANNSAATLKNEDIDAAAAGGVVELPVKQTTPKLEVEAPSPRFNDIKKASWDASSLDSSAGSEVSGMRSRKSTAVSVSSRDRRSSRSPHGAGKKRGKMPSSPGQGRRPSGKFLDIPSVMSAASGGGSSSGSSKPRPAMPSLFLRTQSQDIQVNDLGQSFRGHATNNGKGVDLFEMEAEVDESIAPNTNPSVVGIAITDWRLDGGVLNEILNLKIRVADEKTYRKLLHALASFQ